MGKTAGNSWLTAVKRVFRSPTKEENTKRNSKRRDDHEQEEEEKKRGKRRWIFRKPSNQEKVIQHSEARTITTSGTTTAAANASTTVSSTVCEAANAQQRHALTLAMATTAAAQAAIATAEAAVEVVRLTRPSIFVREHFAAIVIQTTFRGYLARRALRALKGLVKLQALVRGHNVRKRANMTFRCMQALLKVQARMRDQRRMIRLSYEGSTDSELSDPNSLWGSRFADIKPTPRDERRRADDWVYWDEHPQTQEEVNAMLRKTKDQDALKRESSLAYAFSHQIWRADRDTYASEGELEEKPRGFNRWTARKQWESIGRISCDQRDPIKTVEVDISRPYSYSAPQKSKHQHEYQQRRPSSYSVASPLHRAHNNTPIQSTSTPSPSMTKPLQVHSDSPRCIREERNVVASNYKQGMGVSGGAGAASMPNYMAATASANARLRSHSAPRQRPSISEGEKNGSTKRRLSFFVPDQCGNGCNEGILGYDLRSPINKGIHGDHIGIDQRSNMSSCCTDSLGDEISLPSTYEQKRWLR
ncbi:IQ domain-containing protein/DUF4005 domain-containing protein [Cephalotus follicularis]|uniref:IQ domain-containing protein/DUF4005 domain-containing protein n=1 Tax=Cephalotus follicularis TaxID=3775 RepID=A0A1Q3BZI4_CEPFO|nr:IQ domain-containing protein/DUF4005 domain-containing protein [Cephalotus follicularis]